MYVQNLLTTAMTNQYNPTRPYKVRRLWKPLFSRTCLMGSPRSQVGFRLMNRFIWKSVTLGGKGSHKPRLALQYTLFHHSLGTCPVSASSFLELPEPHILLVFSIFGAVSPSSKDSALTVTHALGNALPPKLQSTHWSRERHSVPLTVQKTRILSSTSIRQERLLAFYDYSTNYHEFENL